MNASTLPRLAPELAPGPPATDACARAAYYRAAQLKRLGVVMDSWDFAVALAGNPNTGKSTVFNALTGLSAASGNWPGKTVARAEGGYAYAGKRFKLVDLPGRIRCFRRVSTSRSLATSSCSASPM